MNNTWAVMCGMIRVEFEFCSMLAYLCELRKNGEIDGIIFSTWEGGAHGYESMLDELGVIVLESKPLEQESEYGEMVFLRQGTQLKAALDLLPNDAYILKCRTDYSNYEVNRIMPTIRKLNEADLKTAEFGEFKPLFENRVVVFGYSVNDLFSSGDIVFYGKASDIRNMIVLEDTKLAYASKVESDAWFFAGIFAHKYPIIGDYFRYLYPGFRNKVFEMTADKENFELPDVLNKLYALYFVIAYCNFIFYYLEAGEEFGKTPEPNEYELGIKDIFFGNARYGIKRIKANLDIRNYSIIDQIVNGKLADSSGYRKLYSEIKKIRDISKYGSSLQMTTEDIQELKDWGKMNFEKSDDDWAKDIVKAEKTNNNCGYDEALDILFGRFEVGDREKRIIKDISCSAKGYYNKESEYLAELKEINYKLYKKVLFSLIRHDSSKAIQEFKDLIANGDMDDLERQEANFIIEKFKL